MTKNSTLPNLIDNLRKAPEVALFSHVSPDGDCLGSMLALGLALEKLGKKIQFYNADAVPPYLSFLAGASRITSTIQELPSILLFVDCADWQRVGILEPDMVRGRTVINIDHHISNQFFGDINLVDEKAGACGEIVFEVIKRLQVQMDQDIATALYTAIVTDTGSFQYSNTTAKTHRITGELIDQGIDLTRIHHHLFDQKPLAQVRLLQRALSSLELHVGDQVAIMTLTLHDFKACLAEQNLSEGLVNHARSIAGVEVAIMLREVTPEEVRVAFRSNLWLNVNEIAAKFGGGGHQRAAGCTLKTSVQEAKQRVLNVIEEALQSGRSH